MYQSAHLNAFQDLSIQTLEQWMGVAPSRWFSYLERKGVSSRPLLASTRLSRNDLLAMASDPKISNLDCCISILAWGGMNRKHGLTALSSFDRWNEIVEDMRNSKTSPFEAYERFQKVRASGQLAGMGIAYFTKLIFFLNRQPGGYILDQWTARSANLICTNKKILLNWGRYKTRRFAVVSDRNDFSNYQFFCSFVEDICSQVDHLASPSDTEEALFSMGRGKGSWRQYVIDNDM